MDAARFGRGKLRDFGEGTLCCCAGEGIEKRTRVEVVGRAIVGGGGGKKVESESFLFCSPVSFVCVVCRGASAGAVEDGGGRQKRLSQGIENKNWRVSTPGILIPPNPH